MRMRKRESKHFAKLWREIELAIECAADECGDEFRASCGLAFVKTDQLKEAVEREYRQLRDDLKKECYGRMRWRRRAERAMAAGRVAKAWMPEKSLRLFATR